MHGRSQLIEAPGHAEGGYARLRRWDSRGRLVLDHMARGLYLSVDEGVMLIRTKEQHDARRPHHGWQVTPRRKKPTSYGVLTENVATAGAVGCVEDIMNKAAVRDFFFGSSPVSLRMDLIRIGVWAVVFVVLSAL